VLWQRAALARTTGQERTGGFPMPWLRWPAEAPYEVLGVCCLSQPDPSHIQWCSRVLGSVVGGGHPGRRLHATSTHLSSLRSSHSRTFTRRGSRRDSFAARRGILGSSKRLGAWHTVGTTCTALCSHRGLRCAHLRLHSRSLGSHPRSRCTSNGYESQARTVGRVSKHICSRIQGEYAPLAF
jgi:hypothetical protein